MTRNRGSSVAGSIRTRSMAPGAARWPDEIWAPSKAGPVGLEAASRRCRLPSTSSAFVPTSTISVTSSARCGCSARITPAVSAPTWPAMHGSTYTRAPGCAGSSSSAAVAWTACSVASVNGAWPSGVGSSPSTRWCMIGLPTSTSSRISSVSTPADAASSPTRSRSAVTHGRRHLGGTARRGASRRRRGSSGPRRTGSAGSSCRPTRARVPSSRLGEVPRDRGGADVDRHPVRAVAEARARRR